MAKTSGLNNEIDGLKFAVRNLEKANAELRAELKKVREQKPAAAYIAYPNGYTPIYFGEKGISRAEEAAGEKGNVCVKLYAAPAVTVPDGQRLVPIEPTIEMVIAGENAWDEQLDLRLDAKIIGAKWGEYPSEEHHELCSRLAYRAMLSAAPQHA